MTQRPTRTQSDLAEMLDTLLDKGVVINADIAVTVGDAELLNVHIRAAVASFETAAAYGLAFPSGTDTERLAEAAGLDPAAVENTGVPDRTARRRTGDDPDDSPTEVTPTDGSDAGDGAHGAGEQPGGTGGEHE